MTQLDKIIKRLVDDAKTITAVEAFGLFGISRLSALILRMKSMGYTVVTVYKKGVNCTRYATYSVANR